MCDIHKEIELKTKERGDSLAHGQAHAADHSTWSRRDFFSRIGMAAAGGAFMIGSTPARSLAGGRFLENLSQANTNRVMVLVQLSGGNDGLNTFVPIEDDAYYNARENLGVAKDSTLPMNDQFGFNPNLSGMKEMWDMDQMGVIHGVGYDNINLSHFRSTDIWVSSSDENVIENTGWLGRHIDAAYPDFTELISPLAVQIGSFTPILMQGPQFRMGVSAATVGTFELIADRGELYDTSDVTDDAAGDQLWFLRNTANQTVKYGEAIRNAYNGSGNNATYPSGTVARFADSLKAVARSIRGGLGAKIYVVQLPGFDTHVNQDGGHPRLMKNLSDSIRAFYNDLSSDGLDEDVLTLTFSEFGRRVEENAGRGTDHGTAAPMMAFGPGVSPGMFGTHPSLTDLDATGNMKHHVDYRQVYSTILRDWFGVSPIETAAVLGRRYELIKFVANPLATSGGSDGVPEDFSLGQNFPNPFNPSTKIQFRLPLAGHVKLVVFGIDGKRVQTLIDGRRSAGLHEASFDATNLPSGTYLYSLTAGGITQSRKMSLSR